MGMFPYDCVKCGGGDMRCGNTACKNKKCSGDQFCWEDDMVFKVGRSKIYGRYDGYGRMSINDSDSKLPIFGGMRGIPLNGRNEIELEGVMGRGEIYCKSCFENKA